MHKHLGFTLIELMVTVAIVAILAAIAIPNYSQYVQKTRRTDAQEKLLDMAAQQERWFFNKNQYTDQVADVGGATSKDGYYTVTISDVGSAPYTKYKLTATPVTTKSQSKDGDCTSFTIDNAGARQAFKGSDRNDSVCWPK
jgi:type IV pilus assembly protein PilE